MEGVPTELRVLPKLLRPSSSRMAFRRAGTWLSAPLHTQQHGGWVCTQQGHGWWGTILQPSRAPRKLVQDAQQHANTPQPGTYVPATMHPNNVPEEVLALHDFIWGERLLGSHEDKHLDAERLARRAGARQVSQVVLNELLQWE